MLWSVTPSTNSLFKKRTTIMFLRGPRVRWLSTRSPWVFTGAPRPKRGPKRLSIQYASKMTPRIRNSARAILMDTSPRPREGGPGGPMGAVTSAKLLHPFDGAYDVG